MTQQLLQNRLIMKDLERINKVKWFDNECVLHQLVHQTVSFFSCLMK